MNKPLIGACAATALLLAGCPAPDGDDDFIDVRVDVPEDGDDVRVLVAPEATIEPGEDKMYCWHLVHDGPDLAVAQLETFQGNYGHHVVVLTSLDPQPHDTLEDCTDVTDMWKFRANILPDLELPEGHAVRLEQGTHFVFQFHYVNLADRPILVRDAVRMRLLPMDEVETWVTTLTTNSLNVDVPSGVTATESFDCVLEDDTHLLLVGGHMHEEGMRFEFLGGPDTENLETLYEVDPWHRHYRDAPPIRFYFEEPLHFEAGSILRTSCTWDNTRAHHVGFPEEMCSAFAYVHGTTPIHCEPEE